MGFSVQERDGGGTCFPTRLCAACFEKELALVGLVTKGKGVFRNGLMWFQSERHLK